MFAWCESDADGTACFADWNRSDAERV